MKVRLWLAGMTAVCAFVLLGLPAVDAGGDKKKKEKKPELPEYIMPGPEHKILQKSGKWTYEGKGWMLGPDTKPIPMKGTTTAKMIMGGRYLQENHQGDMMGMKFQGMGITGYDRGQKKWVSYWVDSMGTGFMNSEGTYDKKTKTLTLKSSYFDPQSGKNKKYRMVIRHTSPTTETMAMYEVGGKGEFKIMELTYTKSAGKTKAKKKEK